MDNCFPLTSVQVSLICHNNVVKPLVCSTFLKNLFSHPCGRVDEAVEESAHSIAAFGLVSPLPSFFSPAQPYLALPECLTLFCILNLSS